MRMARDDKEYWRCFWSENEGSPRDYKESHACIEMSAITV